MAQIPTNSYDEEEDEVDEVEVIGKTDTMITWTNEEPVKQEHSINLSALGSQNSSGTILRNVDLAVIEESTKLQ